ncbi:MAG: helix-turn-helix transcriptional regulator [Candidatus Borkfalkiaceae bacterium]|nr:helix-turn-helix transcriptional regulator [Christensenellaceae bacterium]
MIELYTEEVIKYAPLTSVTDRIYTNTHTHTFWEITYTLFNQVAPQVINGKSVDIGSNSFLIIRPFDTHGIIRNGKNIVKDRNIFVEDDKMRKICDSIDKNLYKKLASGSDPIVCPFPQHTEEILEDRLNLFSNYKNGNDSALDTIHSTIVSYLLGLYIESQLNIPNRYPAWIQELLERLRDPEFIKQKVEDIIKTTNYSHGYVCKNFKKITGQTIVNYILEQRLYNSLPMLMDNDKLIIDIALDNNFSSQSRYINAFKQKFGVSPSKWRKENTTERSLNVIRKWGNYTIINDETLLSKQNKNKDDTPPLRKKPS